MFADRRTLVFAFLSALLLTLLLPTLLPKLRLTYFAPFLIMMLYRKPMTQTLWWAIGVGCLLDLLSGFPRMGWIALTYCCTLLTLDSIKPYFFIEKITTLPLMTWLFSLISTAILLVLLALFGQPVLLNWRLIATDFIVYPLVDACYGLLWFLLASSRRRQRIA